MPKSLNLLSKGSWFPVRCPDAWVSGATVDPNLSRQCVCSRKVKCSQISFLGMGSAKRIYKQFLGFYKQFLEFYKQFLQSGQSQRIENSKNSVAERAMALFWAIRNPSPENLPPSKFWRPWSDEVPGTGVLGCKNETFDLRAALGLQPESGDCCGLSTWSLTRYEIWCPVRKRTARKPSSNRQSHPGDVAQPQ